MVDANIFIYGNGEKPTKLDIHNSDCKVDIRIVDNCKPIIVVKYPEVYQSIRSSYIDLLSQSQMHKFPTDNLKVFMHEEIYNELEMGDKLTFYIFGDYVDVPVVIDNEIPIAENDDGSFSSDIFICDPSLAND